MNRNQLAAVVFFAILAGVAFRLYHLDHKVVWSDEIFTRLHVVGLTESDVVAKSRGVRDVGNLSVYLAAGGVGHERGFDATVRSIIAEDPHHAPLYYLVERSWIKVFGDSIVNERLLSAFIGILALPIAFWLAMELFKSIRCAWFFVALMAVSPFFVLYSQENREYALWELSVLLLLTLALRAVRTMSRRDWALYGASIAFSLYTDPLSIAVVGGQTIYFIVMERERLAKFAILPILATGAGVAAFVPWLLVIARNRSQIDRGLAETVSGKDPTLTTIRTFVSEWHLATLDFNAVVRSSASFVISFVALGILLVALIVLHRTAKPRSWALVYCIVVFTAGPMLAMDIIFGGHRSANSRYLVPLFICIELTLAYALSRGVARDPRWAFAFVTLLFGGVASCAASAQAPTWWSKYNEHSISVARAINLSERPIIVSDNYVHFLLSLAPYLKPGTRLALSPRCFLCHDSARSEGPERLSAMISPGDDVFLLGPSEQLQRSVRERKTRFASRIRCIDVYRNCASALKLF